MTECYIRYYIVESWSDSTMFIMCILIFYEIRSHSYNLLDVFVNFFYLAFDGFNIEAVLLAKKLDMISSSITMLIETFFNTH